VVAVVEQARLEVMLQVQLLVQVVLVHLPTLRGDLQLVLEN
jgi:hypothetical protein